MAQLDACGTLAAAATANPAFFPSGHLDVPELEKDLALAHDLQGVATEALSFGEALVDTLRAAKSDAYRAGLIAYGIGQMAESKIPGFGEKLAKMRETLTKPRHKKPTP